MTNRRPRDDCDQFPTDSEILRTQLNSELSSSEFQISGTGSRYPFDGVSDDRDVHFLPVFNQNGTNRIRFPNSLYQCQARAHNSCLHFLKTACCNHRSFFHPSDPAQNKAFLLHSQSAECLARQIAQS